MDDHRICRSDASFLTPVRRAWQAENPTSAPLRRREASAHPQAIGWCRAGAVWAFGAALVLLAEPGRAATTAPAAPGTQPVVPQWSVLERAILDDVADGTDHFDEPALYVLLARVGTAPSPPGQASSVVAWRDLVDDPGAHRGTWVTVDARFVESETRRLSNRMRHNQPVHFSLLVTEPGGDPIQAVTLEAPAGLRAGETVRVRGLFLKVRRGELRGGSATSAPAELSVPIVVARRLTRGSTARVRSDEAWWTDPVVALVLALAVVYYLVRRKAARGRAAAAAPRRARRPQAGFDDEAYHRPVDLDGGDRPPPHDPSPLE